MNGTEQHKNTSIPVMEEEMIQLWKERNIKERLMQSLEGKPKKLMADGPPFANSKTPHIGHLLVSTVKDTKARDFRKRGFDVNIQYGFDTHGLPIEQIMQKEIGYKTKDELMQFGLDKHNDMCRTLINNCIASWNGYFDRIGRWVDHRPSGLYRTMDLNFMESVWWVFQKLYSEKKIYKGFKIMPYSIGCHTPLSHFEAKMKYEDVVDTTITVMLKIISTEKCHFKLDEPTYILVWTTTPWTLPSNQAVCTNENMTLAYCRDEEMKVNLIVSKEYYENSKKKLKLISYHLGNDLVNAEYEPVFTNFYEREKLLTIDIERRPYRILTDAYVKESGEGSGTGFVHLSPAHGEDDFRVCSQHKIIDIKSSESMIDLIDDYGNFNSVIPDLSGLYIKKADNVIVKMMKSKNLCYDTRNYKHSYPLCWRTGTPLIYKAVTGWFVDTNNIQFSNAICDNNRKINWFPESVGTNRFGNWIKESPEWCISRSRYWGTCIPIWMSDDGEEIVCVGSVDELEELSGIRPTDLHIEYLDKITIPSKRGKGVLKRVPDVLDCWFESGSVPYGQIHYPFENTDQIDNNHEAISDFVCESVDQVRGWFYSLNALSTLLLNKPAYKNVIVTGIVNGADGKKMSKSDGNYVDPMQIINKYGADSTRLYLLSTPAVKAESVRFNPDAIEKIMNQSVMKLYNVCLFTVEKIKAYMIDNPNDKIFLPTKEEIDATPNILDRWIINKTRIFLEEYESSMDKYKIVGIAQRILDYIDQLANWYLKMNREKLKGSSSMFHEHSDHNELKSSLQTLLFVLFKFVNIISPVLPFISEIIYQKIRPWVDPINDAEFDSIHMMLYPTPSEFINEPMLEDKFFTIQTVITIIREIRDRKGMAQKRPIYRVKIGSSDPERFEVVKDILEYIMIESNVMNVDTIEFKNVASRVAEPVFEEMKTYLKENPEWGSKNIREMEAKIRALDLNRENIPNDVPERFVKITYKLLAKNDLSAVSDGIYVEIDDTYNEEIEIVHYTRLFNKAINLHRKSNGLKTWNRIIIYYYSESGEIKKFMIRAKDRLINTGNVDILESDIYSEESTMHSIFNDIIYIRSVGI